MKTIEEKRQYGREYRKKNAEKLRVKRIAYYYSHIEECRQRTKDYYKTHGEKVRADAVRTCKSLRIRQRLAVLSHYSNGTFACVKCGFSDIGALVLDHINGGGTEHRRTMKAGSNVWLWLARHDFPSGYQILCANCNAIKARDQMEYGSNSKIGTDWRSNFDWKKQLGMLDMPERGRAWSPPDTALTPESIHNLQEKVDKLTLDLMLAKIELGLYKSGELTISV